MGIRIHELDDGTESSSDGLLGDELLEISRPSATVTMTETTISASVDSDGAYYLDSGDGFITAGFDVGDSVRVQGFTDDGNNVFSARITALTAGVMTIGGDDGGSIVDEAAGDSVTITKWESRRASVQDVLDQVPEAASDTSAVTVLSISMGVVNIDCSLGDYFTLALTANVTSITFSNLPGSGKGASKIIRITQDSTPRTVDWPASFHWAGNAAGAVSTGSGDVDLLAITTLDNGTSWLATLANEAVVDSGSNGTKTYAVLTPMTSQPPDTNFATLDTRNSVAILDFDASTNESVFWVHVMPEGAQLGSGLVVHIKWMASSATSGNVVWGASIERMNTDIDSDSFDTEATVTSAANGTSGIVSTASITITTIDGVTAGDLYRIKIVRKASDGSDTMTGDAELVAVEVRGA